MVSAPPSPRNPLPHLNSLLVFSLILFTSLVCSQNIPAFPNRTLRCFYREQGCTERLTRAIGFLCEAAQSLIADAALAADLRRAGYPLLAHSLTHSLTHSHRCSNYFRDLRILLLVFQTTLNVRVFHNKDVGRLLSRK